MAHPRGGPLKSIIFLLKNGIMLVSAKIFRLFWWYHVGILKTSSKIARIVSMVRVFIKFKTLKSQNATTNISTTQKQKLFCGHTMRPKCFIFLKIQSIYLGKCLSF